MYRDNKQTTADLANQLQVEDNLRKRWIWIFAGVAFLLLLLNILLLRSLCSNNWYFSWLQPTKLCPSQERATGKGSITGLEIAGETIGLNNLSPDVKKLLIQLTTTPTPGPEGPAGKNGAKGTQGNTGAAGPAGSSGTGIGSAQNGVSLSGTVLELGGTPLLHGTSLVQNGNDFTLDATGAGGNLIATGTYGAGTDLAISGPGTRMFWYPKKAALRAGMVTNTNNSFSPPYDICDSGAEWDDNCIGLFSSAFGYDAVASGVGSVAIGGAEIAGGTQSVAFGYDNLTLGNRSVAFGGRNHVEPDDSIAFGTSNVITGGGLAFAFGSSNNVSGEFGLAFGNQNTVSGFAAMALQASNTASGDYSTAYGVGTTASGSNATSFGVGTMASGDKSVAFGSDFIKDGANLLSCVDDYGLAPPTASGYASTAFGACTLASGSESIAFGSRSRATGQFSTAFGEGSLASGYGSTAFGSAVASGNEATAFGFMNYATGPYSTAFGLSNQANGAYSTSFGHSMTVNGNFSVGIGLNSFNSYTVNQVSTFVVAGGNVGLGNVDPAYQLHVGDSTVASGTTVARFENTGGTCDVTPNIAGGVTCTSDIRLKKDINELTDALSSIGAINIVQYRYKAEDETTGLHTGVIAQELEKILPDLVVTDKNGMKSVSYAGLAPYLVRAVQQQNGNLDAINKQLADQGIKLTSLSDELVALSKRVDQHDVDIQELKAQNAKQAQINADLQQRLNKLEQSLTPSSTTP